MSDTAAPPFAVLVIDDDDSVRSLLAATLEMEGFDVSTARSGEEGLRVLGSHPLDCVVLDLMMPGLDGHSVLQQIRGGGDMTLPVIMLTAASDDDQAWQAWSGGVDCFLSKPFDVDRLLREVEKLCAFRAHAASDADHVATTRSAATA
jgi:two-component system response regulator ResD